MSKGWRVWNAATSSFYVVLSVFCAFYGADVCTYVCICVHNFLLMKTAESCRNVYELFDPWLVWTNPKQRACKYVRTYSWIVKSLDTLTEQKKKGHVVTVSPRAEMNKIHEFVLQAIFTCIQWHTDWYFQAVTQWLVLPRSDTVTGTSRQQHSDWHFQAVTQWLVLPSSDTVTGTSKQWHSDWYFQTATQWQKLTRSRVQAHQKTDTIYSTTQSYCNIQYDSLDSSKPLFTTIQSKTQLNSSNKHTYVTSLAYPIAMYIRTYIYQKYIRTYVRTFPLT